MEISQLWRYPVKSMAGERLDAADLGAGGIPGDRLLYVVDQRGEIVSARTRPALLGHRAALDAAGEVLVDGMPWDSPGVAAAVAAAAGPGARLVAATGNERFDILPLLVATDGAIAAFGQDGRRLRPNVVVAGVDGLAERGWQWKQLASGDAVIALADLRARCITTTWDPDNLEQDVDVLRDIRSRFGGTLALNAWTATPGRLRGRRRGAPRRRPERRRTARAGPVRLTPPSRRSGGAPVASGRLAAMAPERAIERVLGRVADRVGDRLDRLARVLQPAGGELFRLLIVPEWRQWMRPGYEIFVFVTGDELGTDHSFHLAAQRFLTLHYEIERLVEAGA